MVEAPKIVIVPHMTTLIELKAIGMYGDPVLPLLRVRTFDHGYEITVVDLAGDPVHNIIVHQKGNVEVDV